MRQLTRRQRVAAIVLAVLALCFVTLDLGGGGLNGAHDGVRGFMGSLYRGTDTVLGPARRWVQGVPSAGTNESRIHKLQQENAQLRGRLDAGAIDRHTGAQLADLQRAADGGDYRVLPARVLAIGPGEGFDWTVTLDAGTGSGVKIGATVTDGAGLVGRVLHADANTSVVLLAVDGGSGVGARDQRTGQVGIVTGAGASGFTFAPLDPKARVKVGDRLFTGPSGASSFVAGLLVGTVTTVHSGADGSVRATVRPEASPTAVDLVGVIMASQPAQAQRAALQPGGH